MTPRDDPKETGPAAGLTLVLGGVRSGKSRFAEAQAASRGGRVLYIATGVVTDGEMAERVAWHRTRRPPGWRTVEAPRDPAAVLAEHARGGFEAVLLDCLTGFVSNLLLEGLDREAILERADLLAVAAERFPAPVIVVSNEVGCGVVPAAPLGRAFRDVQGEANQRLAARASRVYLCVAGIPVRIK